MIERLIAYRLPHSKAHTLAGLSYSLKSSAM